ncbi:hypothetical protein ENKNEFLB_03311 [Nocardioides aquaticus]|uniref:Secreted protein n=1 Tax=Nocardioides aquaticus TaxID=160826 RepID=A0ABX8EK56_9ACTN|nr:DUF5719 family protein [Nocardioides aquaticus]QVT80910.1 hypothetical protein ENKNEFLB_03311 [Nocardioides aquaticus]
MSHAPAPGRRARPSAAGRRRPDVTTVLALVVPLLTVLALLAVDVDPAAPGAVPPERTTLTRSTTTCPGLDAPVVVATTGDEAGEVEVRRGEDVADVAVEPAVPVTAPAAPAAAASLPAEVTGQGDLAPGLAAGRFPEEGEPTAPECRDPRPDQWFTGVGASPRQPSVLELTNPDGGPAVADVVVHGPRGVVDAPSLRGVAVPGQGVVRVELAEEVPRRGDLALHVTTTRGRVGAAVLDRFDDLGAGASGSEWAASQADPATDVLLLGLPGQEAPRELVLANASDDEARVAVSVLTADSEFTPEGSPGLDVAPQGTASLDLEEVLAGAALDDVVGLRLEASRPVTAAVRTVVEGDLAVTPAAEVLGQGGTTTVLPAGAIELVLAAASGDGAVVATPRDADGDVLGPAEGLRADLAPERATVLELPVGTRLLEVRLRGTDAAASVVVRGEDGGGGAAVVRLHDLETSALVGAVRPALP